MGNYDSFDEYSYEDRSSRSNKWGNEESNENWTSEERRYERDLYEEHRHESEIKEIFEREEAERKERERETERLREQQRLADERRQRELEEKKKAAANPPPPSMEKVPPLPYGRKPDLLPEKEEYERVRPPIEETDTSVFYLGVEVSKGKGGKLVPDKDFFKEYSYTAEDYRQMRDLAISIFLHQPYLTEGGTGLGKTSWVKRMCADLNLNYCLISFSENTDLMDIIGHRDINFNADGKEEFVWIDGRLLEAIRNGGIAFLDEYNFQGGKVGGRVNPIIDAVLNGDKTIVLHENNNEVVHIHPDFHLVAAQNPAGMEDGHEFTGRDVLSSEKFGRWNFRKLAGRMSKATELERLLGMIGNEIEVKIPKRDFRERGEGMSLDELKNIPGMEHWMKGFLDIKETLEGKIGRREIGKQSQPITFNPRLSQKILRYIAAFYRGDINQVWMDALEYYVVQMFKEEADRQQIRASIAALRFTPPARPVMRKEISEQKGRDTENPSEAQVIEWKTASTIENTLGITLPAANPAVIAKDELTMREGRAEALKVWDTMKNGKTMSEEELRKAEEDFAQHLALSGETLGQLLRIPDENQAKKEYQAVVTGRWRTLAGRLWTTLSSNTQLPKGAEKKNDVLVLFRVYCDNGNCLLKDITMSFDEKTASDEIERKIKKAFEKRARDAWHNLERGIVPTGTENVHLEVALQLLQDAYESGIGPAAILGAKNDKEAGEALLVAAKKAQQKLDKLNVKLGLGNGATPETTSEEVRKDVERSVGNEER